MRNRRLEPSVLIGDKPGTTVYRLRLNGDPKHLTKLGRPLTEKGWRIRAEDAADFIKQARSGRLYMFTNDLKLALDEMPLERWVDSMGGLQGWTLTQVVQRMMLV